MPGSPCSSPRGCAIPNGPARLATLAADVAVVVAFGQILPQAVLDAPARGSINVHASLLPRYRGAGPIAWSIIRGETETGITTFQMDAGMDTGDMLLREATPIGPEETAGDPAARLAEIGARALLRTLDALDSGSLVPVPQDRPPRHTRAAPQEGRRLAAPRGAGRAASPTACAVPTRGRPSP